MSDYAKDVLVETDWVAEHLDDDSIRIVEVDENPALYAEAHIPGAIGFDWKTDLQDQVQRDFLDAEAFGELMAQSRDLNDHTIVLYGDRNNWFAAYTYWYFRYYGHNDVKLMNGPREKWIDEGRETSTEVPLLRGRRPSPREPATTRSAPSATRSPTRSTTSTALVDVRSPQEFSGELIAMTGYEQEGAQRGGHIPGAASVPWAQAVAEDGTFISADELRELYTEAACSARRAVIAYCRIGERSAHTWFVLQRAARRRRRQELRRLLDRVGQPRRRPDREGVGQSARSRTTTAQALEQLAEHPRRRSPDEVLADLEGRRSGTGRRGGSAGASRSPRAARRAGSSITRLDLASG